MCSFKWPHCLTTGSWLQTQSKRLLRNKWKKKQKSRERASSASNYRIHLSRLIFSRFSYSLLFERDSSLNICHKYTHDRTMHARFGDQLNSKCASSQLRAPAMSTVARAARFVCECVCASDITQAYMHIMSLCADGNNDIDIGWRRGCLSIFVFCGALIVHFGIVV